MKTSLIPFYFFIIFGVLVFEMIVSALVWAEQRPDHDRKKYHIAVLAPAMSPVVEEIVRGFLQTLRDAASFDFTYRLYDGKGDRTLLKSQAEDIFDTAYDLIFSMGTEPTKMMKEVSEKRGKGRAPVIFCGVGDPVGMGIVASLECSGNNVTGVGADTRYGWAAAQLVSLKRNLHHVLIVYDPTQLGGRTVVIKNEVAAALEGIGIAVTAVEIFKATEIEAKVTPFLEGMDALFMLRDHTTTTGVSHLVKLCQNHGISLLASDLDSVKKGAAIGFGHKEVETGQEVARIALQILRDGQKPTDIPTAPVKSSLKILINKQACKQQHLEIDANKMFLVKFAHIVGGGRSSDERVNEALD